MIVWNLVLTLNDGTLHGQSSKHISVPAARNALHGRTLRVIASRIYNYGTLRKPNTSKINLAYNCQMIQP